MSLFAKHISASRKGGRVSVNLRNEDIDPLNGVVADAPVDTEVDEGPEEGSESDKFAAQRALLNRRHGMIRNRRFRQEEVIDEVDGEDEVVIADDGEVAADVDVTDGEEVVVDAPEGEDEVLEVTSEDDEEEVSVEVEDEAGDEVVEEESEESDDEASDDEIVDEVEEDVAEIEDLETEMQMLHDSMIAIESFGINPTAMAVMQTTGLLDGTALESLGLEAFGFEAPSSAETQMALEALGDKVKEKAAAWSSKIVNLVKTIGSKILTSVTAIYTKITDLTKTLTSTSWEKAKALDNNVKAHPYKYIIGVVTAIAAVAGVVAFMGASFPVGGKAEAVQSFLRAFGAKVKAIKVPDLKIKSTLSAAGDKISVSVTGAYSKAKAGTLAAGGWTKSAVTSVGGKISTAFKAVKDSAATYGARGNKFVTANATKAKEGVVAGYNAIIRAFVSASSAVWALVKRVVVGGFNNIKATLSAIAGVFTKSAPAVV